MRFYLVGICLSALSLKASAQDFPGYQTGNYSGVNGVFFNPASIADSRYRWDVNLFAVNAAMSNEKASFNLGSIKDAFTGDELARQFLSKGRGNATGVANATVIGPSASISLDKNSAIALTTRGRVMLNANGVDGKLITALLNEEEPAGTFPYGIQPGDNMRGSYNIWTEYGLSYARVLKSQGNHFLKGGITLKYLSGSANGYLNVNGLQGTISKDGGSGNYLLTNASGRLQLAFAGAGLNDFDLDQLASFDNTGVGADLGFIYEYRPSVNDEEINRDYSWRVGVSILDLGRVKYRQDDDRSAGYDVNVTGSEAVNLNEISNTDFDDLHAYFDAHPQYFTSLTSPDATYSVSLPTTLRVDFDYHVQKGFSVNLETRLSLVNADEKYYNSQYYSTLSLTPRYETSQFGAYLPLQYNKISSFTAGVCLRYGPLFVGSGSLLSAAFGDSKKADAFVGVRFGKLRK